MTRIAIATFTFHHVSIKTFNRIRFFNHVPYSHSTMYLLKLLPQMNELFQTIHSHSTMYLLKPFARISSMYVIISFTFHHVSIKTTLNHQAQ